MLILNFQTARAQLIRVQRADRQQKTLMIMFCHHTEEKHGAPSLPAQQLSVAAAKMASCSSLLQKQKTASLLKIQGITVSSNRHHSATEEAAGANSHQVREGGRKEDYCPKTGTLIGSVHWQCASMCQHICCRRLNSVEEADDPKLQQELLEVVQQLSAANPTPRPAESDRINGRCV